MSAWESCKHWLQVAWCDWTHGGGVIHRDYLGRINWQCQACGRWSDNPVPLRDEADDGTALEATNRE